MAKKGAVVAVLTSNQRERTNLLRVETKDYIGVLSNPIEREGLLTCPRKEMVMAVARIAVEEDLRVRGKIAGGMIRFQIQQGERILEIVDLAKKRTGGKKRRKERLDMKGNRSAILNWSY